MTRNISKNYSGNLIYKSIKQNDKPGYVVNDHLSRTAVTGSLQQPT